MQLREESPYINSSMVYRYCGMIMAFPPAVSWEIFRLNEDGSTGTRVRRGDRSMILPGKYIILDQSK